MMLKGGSRGRRATRRTRKNTRVSSLKFSQLWQQCAIFRKLQMYGVSGKRLCACTGVPPVGNQKFAHVLIQPYTNNN